MELAKKFLDLNCFISFSGIITFKNSYDLRDVVKYVPIEKMMIETDSPFLSPEPFRGKSNTPSMVKYVAKTVADIKKISIDEVGSKTSYNFHNFFLKNYEN
jgi:TatD DNase family protein